MSLCMPLSMSMTMSKLNMSMVLGLSILRLKPPICMLEAIPALHASI